MTAPVDTEGLVWTEYPTLPGFKVCALTGDEDVLVEISDQEAPEFDDAAVEARWRTLATANPRLFDGPILSVLGFRREGSTLRAITRRGSYKLLAVENEVETGTDQLSVTALITGQDDSGDRHVLFGRRGESTRIYGGMWELGPSGGIDPPPRPPSGTRTITDAEFVAQVHAEVEEEMGGGLKVRPEAVVALTHDPVARSYDIVVYCSALGTVTSTAAGADNWEYRGSLWVPEGELAAFDRVNGARVIGPSRALLRGLGWV